MDANSSFLVEDTDGFGKVSTVVRSIEVPYPTNTYDSGLEWLEEKSLNANNVDYDVFQHFPTGEHLADDPGEPQDVLQQNRHPIDNLPDS